MGVSPMLEAALRRNTVGVPPASTAMGPMPPGPTADLETPTLMSAHSLMFTWDQNSTLVPRTHAMDGVPTVFTPKFLIPEEDAVLVMLEPVWHV